MSEIIVNALAAVINPTAAQEAARAEWIARHPVLAGAVFVGCITGVVPALLLGLIS